MDAFCRLACLTYSDDDPARRAQARQLLADNPGLTSVAAEDVLTIARLLLDAGADPNESYLRDGQRPGFTLLTGGFGEGESGPQRQPRHPARSSWRGWRRGRTAHLARAQLDLGQLDRPPRPRVRQRLFSSWLRAPSVHVTHGEVRRQ